MLLSSCWSDRIRYLLMWKIAVSNRFMDLQKYPRNRKSKRKQQPEALDSKICSTFPVIAGSSLVRMPDQQVLPLQFLKSFFLFFVPKGFNWEAASGPLPEALALVLPDSELPAFWKLPLDDIITSCWTQLTVGDTWAGSSYTLPCPLPHSNRPTFKSRPVSESRRGGRPAAHLTCPSTNLIYRPTFPLTDTRNSLAVHSQRSGKV